jgi:hypothetical protein
MIMMPTLSSRRDRAGHGGWLTAVVLVLATACAVLPSLASAAGPGDYAARRFDVDVKVIDGGSLDVTETITFDFQSGEFKKVWREIPTSRTDGIEIVEAWMDDDRFTPGEGPGHILVSGRNRVKVEWQFAPTGPSTHTFRLRYLARGVAYRDGDRDVVRWRALPAEHRYTIDASRITFAPPEPPVEAPTIAQRRVGDVSMTQSATRIDILAKEIKSDGWVIAELRFAAAHVAPALPSWQQRQQDAVALAPRWATAAAAAFVAGLVILVLARQGYSAPGVASDDTTTTDPPSPLPAALASVLAARGRMSGYQPMATLLDLADRGALTVREMPRSFGTRSYEFSQVPGSHRLDDHETEALTTAFAGGADGVSLSKARARLARGARRFAGAVNNDLAERGLIDPARKRVRDRLTFVSVGLLLVAGAGCIAAAPFIPRFEGWPFLVPLGLAISAFVGMIMTATMTPLSDQGLIESARWRGFRRHLKSLATTHGDRGEAGVPPRWIVYAIAIGVGHQWSRYLKKHPDAAPAWFVPSAHDDAGAFAAFVGSSAVGSGSGGAGGGAAGGGGSGAG